MAVVGLARILFRLSTILLTAVIFFTSVNLNFMVGFVAGTDTVTMAENFYAAPETFIKGPFLSLITLLPMILLSSFGTVIIFGVSIYLALMATTTLGYGACLLPFCLFTFLAM